MYVSIVGQSSCCSIHVGTSKCSVAVSDRVNEKVLGKMGIYRFLDGARKGINQGKARN